jgi:short-subunit dehydrogenase
LADELKNKYDVQIEFVSCDLTLQSEIDKLMQFISDKKLPVGILINNAGFGDFGVFSNSDLDRNNSIIDLNIRALVVLTHCVIPQMLQSGRGRILNVASMAAFAPNPYLSVYAATKAFVLNFSHAIAAELSQDNIQVSVLCPGDIRTEFQKNAGLEGFEIKNNISLKELAEYTYQKFMVEAETEIIPDETRKMVEMIQKTTNRKLLSINFFRMRKKMADQLGK